MKKTINHLVSENLKGIKKEVLTENKIIKNRIRIIETYNSKRGVSKKNKVDDIITEMFYLKNQGYKNNVISENIIDWFKNVLGLGDQTMVEPVIDTFKESFIGYVLKIVAPGTSNSYLSNIIKVGLADIDMNDIDKLTNCEFLSDTISKAIVEGTINKLKNNVGLVGGVYDVVRNTLVDKLDDSDFSNKIQDGISNFLCEAVSDKIELLKDKVEELRG
jgi:hypothetical protein